MQRERGGPTRCSGGIGPPRQCPGLRVQSRQPTRRPSRPRSRTSSFSSQGQRTIKGAGELLTGSKRGRKRRRLAHPRVSRMGRPPQPPAHGASRLPGARATSTAAAAAGPRASWARPPQALLPRAPAFARGHLASAAASPLSQSPPGRRGTAPRAAASPWAAAGRLTAGVAAASPAILCRVWCLSRLLARLYSLLLLPPAPHTTQHGLFAAAVAAAAAGAPRRSSLIPSPNLPPAAPGPPVRTRADTRPRRPLARLASCHRFPKRHHALRWYLQPASTAHSCTLFVRSEPTASKLSAPIGPI